MEEETEPSISSEVIEETPQQLEEQQESHRNTRYSSAYLMRASIANRLNDEFKDLLAEFNLSDSDLELEDELEGEEAIEEEHEIEEIESKIDRVEYYLTYDKLTETLDEEIAKNAFLESKLVEYYEKKRMFYVIEPYRAHHEAQHRYENKMEKLQILVDQYKSKQLTINSGLDTLKNKYETKSQQIKTTFEKYEKNLSEIGTILQLPKPKLDRLLRQQRQQLTNQTETRFKLIQLQQRKHDKEIELKQYGDFYDYEQLQENNRNLIEKLQRLDDDLIKYRQQCKDTLQKLAHKREKDVILIDHLEKFLEEIDLINQEYQSVREELNYLQNQRKYYHKNIEKIVGNSSLMLAQRELFQDMVRHDSEA